jgi:hypothetical protein
MGQSGQFRVNFVFVSLNVFQEGEITSHCKMAAWKSIGKLGVANWEQVLAVQQCSLAALI